MLLAVILVTPYAFRSVEGTDREWARWANVGQTYGAASALLSALALLGIVASLRHQAAQRLSDETLARQQRHHDMMRYVFDRPEYSQCWGPRFAPNEVDERLYFYTNIILGEWQASYDLGDLSRADIRLYAAMMFRSELPRMFWSQHGYLRRTTTQRKGVSDFALIISEEFDKAVKAGPPERLYGNLDSDDPTKDALVIKWRRLVTYGVGAAVIVALTHAARIPAGRASRARTIKQETP